MSQNKTKLIKLDLDWKRVKNACRTTVNKDHTEAEPKSNFKTSLLISEHSPIRLLKLSWLWDKIESFVATHFSRSKWECFISTQRSDRTGKNRSELKQDELVKFEGEMNAQNAIDTARKRLCYQSSKETREYMEDLKIELEKHDKELSDVLVPNCIYRCGCPEFKECGYWSKFVKKHNGCNLFNIENRYLYYNIEFYDKLNKEDK